MTLDFGQILLFYKLNYEIVSIMQRYLFYPPFLSMPEETDFSDVWEAFCLKLLKLEYETNEIERRRPPESGVDLYYKKRQIAFQCKSTQENSKFNITKACNSLRSAQKAYSKLPWSQYIICSNDNLTGDQLAMLQAIDPRVDSRGKDHWSELCRRFPAQVKANFRTVCNVPENRIHNDLQLLFNGELDSIKEKLDSKPLKVLIYSHGHDQIYDFVLSKNLTVSDLLLITRRLFNLHETIREFHGELQPYPFFEINNIRYDEKQQHDTTLEELGIEDYATLIFGIDIVFPRGAITRSVMHANQYSAIRPESVAEIVSSIFKKIEAGLRELN